MMLRVTGRRIATLALALLGFGGAVAWSGVVDVGAAGGHWRITAWALHWAMANSVRTQAWLHAPDDARDPGGLVSAAGHFDRTCAICHGAPGRPASPVMQAATPPAPDLRRGGERWTDRELFWIVANGVRYTGMPAWPAAGRDDEVRRMVAFLRDLPSLDAAAYGALVAGEGPARSPGAAGSCQGCHGSDGMGRGADVPVLAGQKATYLAAALRAYRDGTRASGIMQAAASDLGDADVDRLAEHYAGLARTLAAPSAADPRAAEVVEHGIRSAGLPACKECHGRRDNPLYPRLAGQKASYIAARLRQWRGTGAEVEATQPNLTMPVIARRIPEDLIEPLARYWETRGGDQD